MSIFSVSINIILQIAGSILASFLAIAHVIFQIQLNLHTLSLFGSFLFLLALRDLGGIKILLLHIHQVGLAECLEVLHHELLLLLLRELA